MQEMEGPRKSGLPDLRNLDAITPHPPAFANASAGDLSLWER
jgi:hypothetical protein